MSQTVWQIHQLKTYHCICLLISEQAQIANFLDRKTEQIDELIRIKERQIELLQEQRTALINQAVTKGLDPNVEMKPSGVEWVGEIPAHWKVYKTKYLFQLVKNQHPKDNDMTAVLRMNFSTSIHWNVFKLMEQSNQRQLREHILNQNGRILG